jgi:hypothetical protein
MAENAVFDWSRLGTVTSGFLVFLLVKALPDVR